MPNTGDGIWQDLRYAVRGLKRSPALTTAIIVTLALGVGANAALFSVLDRVYFRAPGGVIEPARVQRLYARFVHQGTPPWYTSYFSIPDLRDLNGAIAGAATVAGYHSMGSQPYGDAGDSIATAAASANFFELLGVHAARGRLFAPDEMHFGDPRQVAVISHSFWRRLGGKPGILGRPIQFAGSTWTVVGVMPRGFVGIDLDPVDAWIPLPAMAGNVEGGAGWYQVTGSGIVQLIARVSQGSGLSALNERLTAQYFRTNVGGDWFDRRSSVFTAPVLEALGPEGLGRQNERNLSVAIRLAGVGLALLIIAAANSASLLLMRALRRRREIAVRLALGISRRRLVGQLLVEGVLLAVTAGAVAVLLTIWTGSALRSALLSDVSWAIPVIDARLVAVAMGLSILAGLAASFAPAALVLRDDIALALKTGAPEAGGPGSVLRVGLLVTQAALCMTLLAGAGVFVQSLRRAQTVDMGFDAERLVTVRVSGRPTELGEMDDVARRVATLPGVQGAALSVADLRVWSSNSPVWTADGDTLKGASGPSTNFVNAEFFSTTGLRVVAGRPISNVDRVDTEPVAVITESLARAMWPRGALNQCFHNSWSKSCIRVVGIVKDLRWNVSEPVALHYLMPLSQAPHARPPSVIVIRSDREMTTAQLRAADVVIRATLGTPGAQVLVQRVADRLATQTKPWRIAATLFLLYGILALAAAAAGIYGLVTYDVISRTREFGVRAALGATPGRILSLVVGRGLRVICWGLATGLACSLMAGRTIASLLYETSPFDPMALAASACILVMSTIVASLIPAWRAARLDPVTALRTE